MNKPVLFARKIKNIFLPAFTADTAISNQKILRELLLCFEASFKRESFGNRMLFHTYFYIILHPDDYADRRPALAEITKQAINHFYKLIAKEKSKYEEFIPVSENWCFRFSEGTNYNKLNISVEKGTPVIISMLMGEDLNNLSSSAHIKATYRPKNSDPYAKMDINADGLRMIEVVSDGVFRVRFDENLNSLSKAPRSEVNGFALLSFSVGSKSFQYIMKDRQIIITGKTSSSTSRHVLSIDSPYVETEHLRIKVAENLDSFEIAAFAATTLNQKEMQLSSGKRINWMPLGKNSEILLGQMFNIEFESRL